MIALLAQPWETIFWIGIALFALGAVLAVLAVTSMVGDLQRRLHLAEKQLKALSESTTSNFSAIEHHLNERERETFISLDK